MQRILVLLLAGWLLAVGDVTADEKSETTPPADATKTPAFLKEFVAIRNEAAAQERKLSAAYQQQHKAAQSQDERESAKRRLIDEARKITLPTLEKVKALVVPHASDPASVEALIWMVNKGRETGYDDEAADLLIKHHLVHQETIELACRSSRGGTSWAERMLNAQLAAKNLPTASRPRVLYALAELKQTESRMPITLDQMSEEQLALMQQFFGKDSIARLRKVDVAQAELESIQRFKELEEKHGSETVPGMELTYGDLAKSALFEIQHLSVGKQAPEIAGEDTDGVQFKLSDYRGKVVLLSFWGTWCGPCMQMVPQEREIVERMKERPFALIGVNSDKDKDRLKTSIEENKINWRSFWCGEEGPLGKIPRDWNVNGWPTVYVLDHKGIIRAKEAHGTSLDHILDKLVAEVEAAR